jgi:ribose 5-phosphate isomerase B
MKIAIGADHKGFDFKNRIRSILEKKGIEVEDVGTYSEESTDYPDFGVKVSREVASGNADYGMLICWTGNGMAISANKIRGIRAGLALSPEMARLTRAHNNANVLVLSGLFTPVENLEEIIDTFLETEFEGGRHLRRINKIKDEEDNQ